MAHVGLRLRLPPNSQIATSTRINIPIRRVEIVAFQPDGPLHGLEGLKNLPSSDVPEIFDPLVPHQILEVSTEAAYAMARRLAREEGLLVGPSSAAAAVAASELAQRLDTGHIVTIFADSGLKYLDQAMWSET